MIVMSIIGGSVVVIQMVVISEAEKRGLLESGV